MTNAEPEMMQAAPMSHEALSISPMQYPMIPLVIMLADMAIMLAVSEGRDLREETKMTVANALRPNRANTDNVLYIRPYGRLSLDVPRGEVKLESLPIHAAKAPRHPERAG